MIYPENAAKKRPKSCIFGAYIYIAVDGCNGSPNSWGGELPKASRKSQTNDNTRFQFIF
jgi:hypothetical protein